MCRIILNASERCFTTFSDHHYQTKSNNIHHELFCPSPTDRQCFHTGGSNDFGSSAT